MEIVEFELPDAVISSTVQGLADYWVALPPGSKPIAYMNQDTDLEVGGLAGAVLEYDYDPRLLLDSCEALWTASDATNIVMSLNTASAVVGTYCNKAAVDAGAAAGAYIYKALPATTDLSNYNQIAFWIKCSVGASAGDFIIGLCSDVAGATPVVSMNVPALTGGALKLVVVDIPDPSLCSAIKSIEVEYNTDLGACDFYIDDIRAYTQRGKVAEQLTINDYIIGSEYFSILGGIAADTKKINRKIKVFYDSFETCPVAPVT